MKSIGEAFERVAFIGGIAVGLWVIDRALVLLDLAEHPVTLQHALGIAGAIVVGMWVVWGKRV